LDRSIYTPSPWAIRYHQCSADEVLGGGSAGLGKSLSLLWDPIVSQAVVEKARMTGVFPEGFPGWLEKLCRQYPIRPGESEGHALHMRRSMPQLKENIARSLRMFPKFDPEAVYSKEDHSWTFSTGYQFTFGHCREADSHTDYLSKQYTHLALDEAWTFLFLQFDELDARVRSADPVLRLLLRTRLMSNPAPGWLKQEFVDPAPQGNVELRRKVTDPETGETRIKTRIFLPGKLDDNPDKGFAADYKFKLLSKPAHMRARYLYGDWDAAEGAFFEEDWNREVHVAKRDQQSGKVFKIPRDWPKFRVMDWGYKVQGVICWFAIDPDETEHCFYEFNFKKMKDEECADRVIDIESSMGFWNKAEKKSRLMGVADTQLWEERGDSGVSKADVFAAKGVYWQPADKASIARNAERIITRLRDYDAETPPGLIIYPNCRKTIEMFASIKCDEKDSTIPDKKSPLKHWFDVQAYAAAHASNGAGSIVMDMHPYDIANMEQEAPVRRASGTSFGYGN
jgi:hypothetical protein